MTGPGPAPGAGPTVPAAERGPDSWRWSIPPPLVDVAILAVLLVPQLLFLARGTADPSTGVAPAGPVVLGAVVTAAHLPVLLRRHRPWTALGLTLLASVAVLALGDGMPGLALAVLAQSVGYGARRRVGGDDVVAAGLAATVLVTGLGGWIVGGPVVAPVAAVGVGAVTGLVRRKVTRRRVDQRERADAAAVQAALAADRRRIGAELHEVVRARLVEIVGHADGARSGDSAPETALEAIAQDTRGALTALREMLTLLRAPDGPEASPALPLFAGRGGDREDETAGPPAVPGRGWRAVEWSDVALALCFAVAVPLVALPARAEPPPVAGILAVPTTAAGWALLAAGLVPLLWRRRYASAGVWVASVGLTLAPFAGGGGYTVASVAWSVLVVTAVSRDPWRRWVPAVVVGAVTGLAALPVVGLAQPSVPVLLTAMLSHGVLVVWGLTLRWRRSSRSAARLRQQHVLAAVSRREQRLRIARDLHDVVAHHVSGMAVQAGSAHALATDRPDLVAEALAHVRETGRSTLAAMPALLDALDEGPSGAGPLAAGGLDRLAEPLRAAGAPVEVRLAPAPEVAGQVAREVRWMVQEALTNVLRHAGPAPTRVSVLRRGDAVEVTVCDDGPVGDHRADPGGGFGLIGMRERVAALGGEIETGPAGTGWRVHARLPCAVPDLPDGAPARVAP